MDPFRFSSPGQVLAYAPDRDPVDNTMPEPAPYSNIPSPLPPLRIGPLTIDYPIIQAALSGYSDRPMRVLARELGAGAALAEVMLDKFILDVSKGRAARRYVEVDPEEHPVGAQIMGADPAQFALAATEMVQRGFDFIDINFGCPVKKVIGKCRGGYLLTRPERALEIVAKVREVVPPSLPVTVKMRRGFDESTESRDNFYEILDGAFNLGVAAITVHGRYVLQRYVGQSDWDFLTEVKQHVGEKTILGSGDLFRAENCLEMMQQTGVDGVTVARGAIGNPWIFRETQALAEGRPLPAPPTLHEQRQLLARHYELAEELYGPRRAATVMRKFGVRYAKLHPQPDDVRLAFVSAKTGQDWADVLDHWYGVDGPGRRH
jgi:tRNA-dihydrouridine synthase B